MVRYNNVTQPTKEFFIPVTTSTGAMGSYGDFPTALLAGNSGEGAWITFDVPADFNAITACVIEVIPRGTDTACDITTDYGATGEAFDTHSESITLIVTPTVDGVQAEIDVSAALTNLAAGDHVGVVGVDSNNLGNTDFHVKGLRFKYV